MISGKPHQATSPLRQRVVVFVDAEVWSVLSSHRGLVCPYKKMTLFFFFFYQLTTTNPAISCITIIWSSKDCSLLFAAFVCHNSFPPKLTCFCRYFLKRRSSGRFGHFTSSTGIPKVVFLSRQPLLERNTSRRTEVTVVYLPTLTPCESKTLISRQITPAD